jgi:hypothetical protein
MEAQREEQRVRWLVNRRCASRRPNPMGEPRKGPDLDQAHERAPSRRRLRRGSPEQAQFPFLSEFGQRDTISRRRSLRPLRNSDDYLWRGGTKRSPEEEPLPIEKEE